MSSAPKLLKDTTEAEQQTFNEINNTNLFFIPFGLIVAKFCENFVENFFLKFCPLPNILFLYVKFFVSFSVDWQLFGG